jgi:hypothetical protein
LFCFPQKSLAFLNTLAVCRIGGEKPSVGPRSDTIKVSLFAGIISVVVHPKSSKHVINATRILVFILVLSVMVPSGRNSTLGMRIEKAAPRADGLV